MRPDWNAIQGKWRRKWEERRIFESEPDHTRKKYFVTVAYPYPNSPQHIGHGRTYTLADVHARYMRMQGYNVLFPMGFHYTGTPILAMSKRIAANDKDLIETFVSIYKVPGEEISNFKEPIKIASYFHDEIKLGMQEMGYSIDWRREFTTIDRVYTRFISWQFRKLREKGLVAQGSHPVGWCPNDRNPVSQHDTVGDVEPEFTEYTLVKFGYDGYKIPTATLRPETVFGATNLWINPDAEYVKTIVNGESWIVSSRCAEKLGFLNRDVAIKDRIKGKELVGKTLTVPLVKRTAIVLPASFVDPADGTGIVMSVPAHAPYDYQALEDLKKNVSLLSGFGIDGKNVETLEPIVMIESERYKEKEIPALVAIKDRGIKTQEDPKLEDATTDLYSHEFYKGRMLSNTMKYAGMDVARARNEVRADMLEEKLADTMLDLIKPVRCRCGTECVVKLLSDQWFINYSDAEWKSLAHRCIGSMQLMPDEIRPEFEYTIDWLKERACARKSGLGTKLPWDEEWIIESLSDSVIYMAYYIIAKYLKEEEQALRRAEVNDSFFDYVLLGIGDAGAVARSCNLQVDLVNRIRSEFEYFYPVDSRHSGRDLVPNHLSFFVFNHAAIFTEQKWPGQIVVNGSVLMEGRKMSKSLGNIVPLRSAVRDYGADPIRISMLVAAELLQDADFTLDAVTGIRDKLERIYSMCAQFKLKGSSGPKNLTAEDRWLLSRLQHTIKNATASMERLRIREALHNVFYAMDQDMQWYLKRASAKGRSNKNDDDDDDESLSRVVRQVLDARVRMLAPFAPFISEEMWELLGNGEPVALASWPRVDENQFDYNADESETLISNLLEDAQKIIRVTKIRPSRIFIYIASGWKWEIYGKVLSMVQHGKRTFGEVMKMFASEGDENAGRAKQSPEMVKRMVDDILSDPVDSRERKVAIQTLDESSVFEDSKSLLAKELGAEILIFKEDDEHKRDPKNKARVARPYKPALYME
ncbi:MAG: leucine--tRNA ligase [Nitrososphaerales archaeon]